MKTILEMIFETCITGPKKMLSRRKRSITGKKVASFAEVNIKPNKARKIIRRYHFLINKKKIICNKLGISADQDPSELPDPTEELSIDDSQEMEKLLLRVQDKSTPRSSLVRCLHYITSEISKKGGLEDYQLASRVGQSQNRGGDSSKLLVKWLHTLNLPRDADPPLTALEIGSLNCDNCISTSKIFHTVTRIDLNNSNDSRGILRQDFMQRPLPATDHDRFDLISCSLVLNFVPTPQERGKMLYRLQHFLKRRSLVFLVLPLPCTSNSRYLDHNHFTHMLAQLGYEQLRHHESSKLYYGLYSLQNPPAESIPVSFRKKTLLHDKPAMNNFCILI